MAGLKARQQGPKEEAAKERAMIAGAALVINIARSLERIAADGDRIARALQSLDAQHGAS